MRDLAIFRYSVAKRFGRFEYFDFTNLTLLLLHATGLSEISFFSF